MGGDHAPGVVVEGAVLAAREYSLQTILVGDETLVKAELAKHIKPDSPEARLITVHHASEVVGMGESPAVAIKKKKDSSLRVSFELVKNGEASAVVSAGNSGAAMAAGIFLLKRLKGVERPAIATCVPTKKKALVLLDVGGNVDNKPSHLVQFAAMGDVYAKHILGYEKPRVAVLNNGEEEGKGNELTRGTNELLKDGPLNYIGYVEGKELFDGDVDVVVTDGFVGNVVLKLTEGLVGSVMEMLKEEIEASTSAKIGYLFAKGAFGNLKKRFDYAEYGGAPLLGIDGICIISHGGSSARAIKNALRRAKENVDRNVNEHILEELGALAKPGETVPFKRSV